MNIYWDKALEKILQLMLPSEAKMLHIFCFKSVHKKKKCTYVYDTEIASKRYRCVYIYTHTHF